MGIYDDPYDKFGQLTYDMWRAVRLVVDTGMHYKDWSRDDAVNLFLNNTAKTVQDINNEVDRYIAWPGQALAYKIGQLKIMELRDKAKAALGDDFDIKDFHDHMLSFGSIPLNILEESTSDAKPGPPPVIAGIKIAKGDDHALGACRIRQTDHHTLIGIGIMEVGAFRVGLPQHDFHWRATIKRNSHVGCLTVVAIVFRAPGRIETQFQCALRGR